MGLELPGAVSMIERKRAADDMVSRWMIAMGLERGTRYNVWTLNNSRLTEAILADVVLNITPTGVMPIAVILRIGYDEGERRVRIPWHAIERISTATSTPET